jgi:hypothetical protein
MAQLTYTPNQTIFPGATPISISDIQTTTFNQEAQYDSSNSDYLYTKVTITVRGLINTDLAPSNPGETPAQTLARIRKCLLSQCGLLVFNNGAANMITSPQNGANEDAKHGPFPISLSVAQITEATFIVDYTITTYIIECCSNESLPYISHRWSETLNINQDMYTRRSIRGLIIFRADQINSKKFDNGLFPDQYRALIPPNFTILPNNVREQVEWTVAEDGLSLAYSIVDMEQYTAPPGGATRWSGEHTTQTAVAGGGSYTESISVKLTGPPVTVGASSSTKSALISKASKIILGRLAGALDGTTSILKGGMIRDSLASNEIEVRVDVWSAVKTGTYTPLHLQVQKVAQFTPSKLDYILGVRSPDGQPDPGMAGPEQQAMVQLSNYLQLCVPVATPNQGSLYPYQSIPVQSQTSIQSNSAPSIPQSQSVYNPQSQADGIYTQYDIDVNYINDDGNMQLPYMSTQVSNSAIIPINNVTQKKIVRFKATKLGAAPTVPNWLTTNQNCVLMDHTLSPMTITPFSDGVTPVFTLIGEYIYGVINAAQEQIVGGIVPYMQGTWNQYYFNNFSNGIIDQPGTPSQSQGGGGGNQN